MALYTCEQGAGARSLGPAGCIPATKRRHAQETPFGPGLPPWASPKPPFAHRRPPAGWGGGGVAPAACKLQAAPPATSPTPASPLKAGHTARAANGPFFQAIMSGPDKRECLLIPKVRRCTDVSASLRAQAPFKNQRCGHAYTKKRRLRMPRKGSKSAWGESSGGGGSSSRSFRPDGAALANGHRERERRRLK
jgi:hypothetical protein